MLRLYSKPLFLNVKYLPTEAPCSYHDSRDIVSSNKHDQMVQRVKKHKMKFFLLSLSLSLPYTHPSWILKYICPFVPFIYVSYILSLFLSLFLVIDLDFFLSSLSSRYSYSSSSSSFYSSSYSSSSFSSSSHLLFSLLLLSLVLLILLYFLPLFFSLPLFYLKHRCVTVFCVSQCRFN